MNALTTKKQSLLDRIGRLIESTQGTDFVIPEDTGYFSIEDDLIKRIRALIRETADLAAEVMECYDADSAAADPGEISATDDEAFLREIGAQISSQMAVEEVSGLAFVSQGQVLEALKALDEAVARQRIWEVASSGDTGLRRAGRALVALESAIRECEGLPVSYRPWQNLDDSLEVRRLYGELRRSILARGDEDAATELAEIKANLRHAARHIARLRSLEIYPYLRIDDRLQIRRLQKRIHQWLEDTGASAKSGALLWSDLVAFARLLGHVNQRQEIREHDRLAVNGLCRRFFEAGELPAELTPEILSLLDPLLGCEDELDQIILNPREHTGQDLQAPLERLRRALGKPFESTPHDTFLQG